MGVLKQSENCGYSVRSPGSCRDCPSAPDELTGTSPLPRSPRRCQLTRPESGQPCCTAPHPPRRCLQPQGGVFQKLELVIDGE